MAELREVSPAIIGRRLRILPYSTHPKNVCLRVELYGCLWTGKLTQQIHGKGLPWKSDRLIKAGDESRVGRLKRSSARAYSPTGLYFYLSF